MGLLVGQTFDFPMAQPQWEEANTRQWAITGLIWRRKAPPISPPVPLFRVRLLWADFLGRRYLASHRMDTTSAKIADTVKTNRSGI